MFFSKLTYTVFAMCALIYVYITETTNIFRQLRVRYVFPVYYFVIFDLIKPKNKIGKVEKHICFDLLLHVNTSFELQVKARKCK